MDANCENRRSAAAYISVSSSGNPAQLSVASQMQAIKEYAENNGAHVTDWYVDEGDSGTSMERPALKELLAAADADEKSFGTVLVWNWSKLSRSAEDFRLMKLSLGESGIELVSVCESGDSQAADGVFEGLLQALAEASRQTHREATRRGIYNARRRRLQRE